MASLSSAEWRALCDKFTTAQNLSEVESRKDPANDPFRSKYKARELLREIYCALKSFETTEGENESGDQRPTEQPVDGEREDGFGRGFNGDSPAGLRAAKLGAVEYYLGVNHIETEELSAGQEHLMNCMKQLEKCSVSSENVSLYIHVRNQLGILWAGRDETEKAQGFLETAESIYQRYMKEEGSPPMDMTEYFTTEENQLTHQERTKRFELAYTHTMYYLAQVYKNLGEQRTSLNCVSVFQCKLVVIGTSIPGLQFRGVCILQGRYMEGRHCLSAATVIAGLAGEVPSEAAAQESKEGAQGPAETERAEIARCWIKYCLNLLQDAEKLLQDNIGSWILRQEECSTFGSEDTFDSIASLEEKVRCLFPLDFTEARAVFLVGQTYVTQAKEYFEIDGYVTDHIEILQDHSALFKALAFFEEDLERRCKMHKRRIDMLEPICNDLNAQYYLLIRRQLMFELAETYNEMMDLKLSLANRQADTQPLDNHTIKKFNHLCSSSILPDTGSGGPVQSARLHSRLICSVPSAQLDNLNKSLDNYKYVVEYCEAHPEAVAAVETELELSQEMVGLLPIKINRLKARMATNN
uniref:KIF-binding protein n=1 Tax=Myripristis murdjan TaxID=586833 RepID=A0A667Y1C7_9TELE